MQVFLKIFLFSFKFNANGYYCIVYQERNIFKRNSSCSSLYLALDSISRIVFAESFRRILFSNVTLLKEFCTWLLIRYQDLPGDHYFSNAILNEEFRFWLHVEGCLCSILEEFNI